MLVVDLACTHGHVFEGWFASAEDLSRQQAQGLVSCPMCGATEVTRRPSAAHVQTRSSTQPASRGHPSGERGPRADGMAASPAGRDEAATREREVEVAAALQRAWLEAAREIVARTEDVGDRFAQEARAIHHGDAPQRGIRGQASAEERAALADEGIEVMSLPLPAAAKSNLQ